LSASVSPAMERDSGVRSRSRASAISRRAFGMSSRRSHPLALPIGRTRSRYRLPGLVWRRRFSPRPKVRAGLGDRFLRLDRSRLVEIGFAHCRGAYPRRVPGHGRRPRGGAPWLLWSGRCPGVTRDAGGRRFLAPSASAGPGNARRRLRWAVPLQRFRGRHPRSGERACSGGEVGTRRDSWQPRPLVAQAPRDRGLRRAGRPTRRLFVASATE
jgi:hypothetical protein